MCAPCCAPSDSVCGTLLCFMVRAFRLWAYVFPGTSDDEEALGGGAIQGATSQAVHHHPDGSGARHGQGQGQEGSFERSGLSAAVRPIKFLIVAFFVTRQ